MGGDSVKRVERWRENEEHVEEMSVCSWVYIWSSGVY